MVDREARDMLAQALRQFASKRLTNDEFEVACPNGFTTKDRAIAAVEHQAWFLYDDLSEHRLEEEHELTPESRREIAKWILFLQTDQEYSWPDRPLGTAGIVFAFVCLIGLALIAAPEFCVTILGGWYWVLFGVYGGFACINILAALVKPLRRHVEAIYWPIFKLTGVVDGWRTRRWLEHIGMDDEGWPFPTREDFQEALRRPRLLCGKTRS